MSRGIDQVLYEAKEEYDTLSKLMEDDDVEMDAMLSEDGDGEVEVMSDSEIDELLAELEDD